MLSSARNGETNSGFRRHCVIAVARSYREEPGYRAAQRQLPRPSMATTSEAPSFRRAVFLVTVSSFLVPAAGVLTQPVLARTLGADGRGELTAAMAPSVLALAVATLGLPEALTFYLAKHPRFTRPALLWATLVALLSWVLCLGAAYLAVPFLSAGQASLGRLIMLAMVLTIPALVVGMFRGAAAGRQMWGSIAAERLVYAVLRVLGLGLLWMFGELTVFTAVLVSCLSPVVAGLVYVRLLLRPTDDETEQPDGSALRLLLSYRQSGLVRLGGRHAARPGS